MAVLLVSAVAVAAPRARSVGSPTEGKLEGAVRLDESRSLRCVGEQRWALPGLVTLLKRAAERVHKRHPDAKLTVGDLSAKHGGDLEGHRSHESGRDVDLGFYLTSGGKGVLTKYFAKIDEDGRVVDMKSARFDDERNWRLVEALLTERSARVTRIFIAAHLEQRLLATAARLKAPRWLRDRAAEALFVPKGVLPHDDHFHVRVACPSGQRQCVEAPTPRKRRAKPAKLASRAGAAVSLRRQAKR